MKLFRTCYTISTTLTKNMNLAGINFSENSVITGDVQGGALITAVPVAQAGTLTTRTNGTDGTLTMISGSHGIITGQRMDIYWSGGYAYGATVGTVSGTSVPFTGAAGIALPIATTAVNAATPLKRVFSFTGNNLKAKLSYCAFESLFVYANTSHAELGLDHNQASVVSEWYSTLNDTNPLSGAAVAEIWMSHGDPAATHDMQAAFMVSA